ncbi:major facilitator superfamily domain-containing protein [Helicostylum pulchrum]|nr:major facilitator superfamily domain-containing protein [Helicostylum pulchrum]
MDNCSNKSSSVTLYLNEGRPNQDNSSYVSTQKEENINEQYTETLNEQESEGIKPWLVVLATFLVLVVGLGAGTGWGVMQNYFEQHDEFAGTSNLSFQLTFVATICNILINLLAPLGQLMLALMEARTVLFTAIVLCSAGLLLASFSTQVWHLYLTHGVIYGIGSSILFYIALSVVPLWFVKNRGIALGIISSGISIGGLVMPLIMEPLNTKLGAAWCYRILSLICFAVGVLACLIFKNKKNEDTKPEKLNVKEMFDFSIAKDRKFLLWCATDILLEAAFNIPYYFLPSYATHLGLTSSQGAIILSAGSGMNAFGRIVSGFLADYVGHVNIIIVYSIISGLSNLVIWTYANSFGTLMAFSIIFGFFGGAFITLTPTITLLTTGYEKFDSGLSVFLVITVISMFGPNLAGAIEGSLGSNHPFDSYKYFTGGCYLAGAVLLIIFKLALNRNPFVKI